MSGGNLLSGWLEDEIRCMTKSELVIRLWRKFPELTAVEAERIINLVLSRMVTTLKQGGRIELRGFGALSVRRREARIARNPKTGQEVSLSERHAIYFRTGRELREKVNRPVPAE